MDLSHLRIIRLFKNYIAKDLTYPLDPRRSIRVRFEWDAAKDAINRRKHGMAFSSVISVFRDPNLLTIYDGVHSVLDEDRWISLGRTDHGIVCLVCHTDRSNADVKTVRIISARKADRDEEKQYYSL